jgi:hypothetical protein
MYSQSVYPIQRIENKDTVVVMTKAQAVAMNKRFLTMDSTIKAYDEAYKYKYLQYSQASQALARQDSVVTELNKQLLIKPTFKRMTQQDVMMSTYFIMFSSALLYLNFR